MGVVTLTFLIPTLALSSLTPALQPHPRVNFCPLPSEQCYQTPGEPEDRGLAWVGCHGAPQHSQVSTGTGGWGDLGQGGDRGICISLFHAASLGRPAYQPTLNLSSIVVPTPTVDSMFISSE